MPEEALTKAVVEAGTGAILSVVILVGIYRIASRFGHSFVTAQQRAAEALAAQAQSLEGLTGSIREFVSRDTSEHREMLVLLRFMAQQQKSFDEVRFEHNIRKKQAHPHCTHTTA